MPTRLYALVDMDTLREKGITLDAHLENILTSHQVTILQYRNKNGTFDEKKGDLIRIRRFFNGLLIVNDDIDLIEFADGLHLGQEDIRIFSDDLFEAVKLIRKKIEGRLLGLSTHNKEEILRANRLDVDYIGLGAYRKTETKSEVNVGGEALIEIANNSKHPVAIIGGVTLEDTFREPIRYKVIGSGLYT